MLSRRGFLRVLMGTAAGAALAPYIPKSYFFVGKAAGVRPGGISLVAANEIMAKHFMSGIIDNIFKSGPLLEYLRNRDEDVFRNALTYQPQGPITLPTATEVAMYAR